MIRIEMLFHSESLLIVKKNFDILVENIRTCLRDEVSGCGGSSNGSFSVKFPNEAPLSNAEIRKLRSLIE